MTREDAEARMLELLGDAANLLTEPDIDEALDRSLTWDSEGRPPSDPDYVETYDPYWAAAEAASILAVRATGKGGILKFSSEGSSFERTAPDFWAMARALRARSPMGAEYGTGIGAITVNGRLAHYRPTSSEYAANLGVIGNWTHDPW